MDEKFTQSLAEWLNIPAAERDLAAGALLLLRVNHNRIMYLNIMRAPQKYAEQLEYQIRKWHNFRLQQQTHAQVEQMAKEAEHIAADHNLDSAQAKPADTNEDKQDSDKPQAITAGRRADHDTLPDEIQTVYAENLDILRRMREVHLRLRTMSKEMEGGQMCPDSDRYPFLKELISLDKQYHKNWETYDNYKADA